MKLMDLNKIAETVPQPVFYLEDQLFLPHYRDPDKWVGPGSPDVRQEFSDDELIAMGARSEQMNLWQRSWT